MDAEESGLRALKKSGKYITVTGPIRFIGENRLSYFQVYKVFSHVIFKSIFSRIFGPRYIFGEMKPSKTIYPAISNAVKHQIKIPVSQVPFEVEAVKEALKLVLSHRAKGRIVIDFSKSKF